MHVLLKSSHGIDLRIVNAEVERGPDMQGRHATMHGHANQVGVRCPNARRQIALRASANTEAPAKNAEKILEETEAVKKMTGLNKYSSVVTQPKKQGASQAMLYATGLTEDDMDKPQVQLLSMYNLAVIHYNEWMNVSECEWSSIDISMLQDWSSIFM